MVEMSPSVLALDFDGVLCDGLLEYFQTAWRAYCQIWSPPDKTPPESLAEQFYRLRPVVETGWEMPVVLGAILAGITEAEILADWGAIAPAHTQASGLSPTEISSIVDQIRDDWIAQDLEGWLALHRFYPGVIERLRQALASSIYPVIITTKEERFVHQLLQRQGIDLPESQVFGKSQRRPKAQTLRLLSQQFSQPTVWFIEDRLKTLHTLQTQPDLSHIRLFLADWGYNTVADRQAAAADPTIHLLSLTEFAADFSRWH